MDAIKVDISRLSNMDEHMKTVAQRQEEENLEQQLMQLVEERNRIIITIDENEEL